MYLKNKQSCASFDSHHMSHPQAIVNMRSHFLLVLICVMSAVQIAHVNSCLRDDSLLLPVSSGSTVGERYIWKCVMVSFSNQLHVYYSTSEHCTTGPAILIQCTQLFVRQCYHDTKPDFQSLLSLQHCIVMHSKNGERHREREQHTIQVFLRLKTIFL